MNQLTAAVLTIRFLLEVCALGALAYWGWTVGDSDAVHILLAIGTPLAAGVIWGLVVAPRARFVVPPLVRLAVEVGIFAGAGGALAATGHGGLGLLLFIVAVGVGLLVRAIGAEVEAAPASRTERSG